MSIKRTNRIIFFENKKNNINKGTNIFTSVRVFCGISSEVIINNKVTNVYNIQSFFNNNNYIEDFDNKLILSARISDSGIINKKIYNFTLLTQNQLFNNIKYIYKNNNFSKPKIVFIKNKNTDTSNNRYLFRSKQVESSSGTTSNIYIGENYNKLSTNDFEKFNNYESNLLHIGFNFYKIYEKSDYYKIKFTDFLNKNLNTSNSKYKFNINNENIKYKITDISINNDFSNNKLLNYDENNFKTLFYHKDNSLNNVNLLNKNVSIIDFSNDNIFIYNQYSNKTIIDICYNLDLSPDISYNLKINFEIIKTKNITSPYYGKILLNNNFININGYVLGENTNFFIKNDIPVEKHTYFNDASKIFLSLGNGLTGITQRNINNLIKFEKSSLSNNNKIFENKILFKYTNNRTLNNNILKENYLLDNSYNYNYTNTFYIQKNQPTDPITNLPIKKFDISLIDYFNVLDFSNSFNNIEILNNQLSYTHYNVSYNNSNIFFKVDNINDIYLLDSNLNSTTNFNLKLNIVDSTGYINYNNINIFGDIKEKITNKLYYDFRYNYSKQYYFTAYFDILYKLENNELFETSLKDLSNNLLLNFNKFVITNYFETSSGSDFTNVDCIFRYHDPYNTPDPSFRYPNNNIEILRDVNIDNLSKAIELLPNARTGTSNSIFLPARNGSNLSRKMIQGYIGMNNIPKLLSIEPYDPNVINNRGFNNQLNFQGGTISADELKLTDKDKVALKYESQKHNLQKNIVTTSRKNFVSLVRQPARSRNVNLTQTIENCPNPINNISSNQYITPFKFFKTGRGSYLNSGK